MFVLQHSDGQVYHRAAWGPDTDRRRRIGHEEDEGMSWTELVASS